jgi:dicarboxylate/amino acid:cation (Na+ or H+) symporter, DAACS family
MQVFIILSIKKFCKSWHYLSSWKKIVIALVSGAIFGLVLGPYANYLKPIGTLFISAIHMMVTPVVFTAIVCAVLSVTDAKKMRRVSIQAIIIYAVSMAVAAAIGIAVALLIKPGISFHPMLRAAGAIKQAPSFIQIFENIIPRSPIAALANENILQIVVFALILGVAIRLAEEKAKPVVDLFNSFSAVVFKLAGIVISFAPYGIFALIAWTFGNFGFQAVAPLAKFVGTVYLGCFLQVLFVYVLTLLFVARLNPIIFFKGASAAIIFAYTTSSSAATLPLSIRCAEKKLGISESVARFLLPLGSSFNLNGLSIYLSVAVIFAANIYGIHLSTPQYITIVSTIVLTAMGAAAVPGSALIVMGAVMSAVGIPLGALALIAGVDRLNDMAQTATNVTGDLFSATLVADNEGLLDRSQWEHVPVAVDDT